MTATPKSAELANQRPQQRYKLHTLTGYTTFASDEPEKCDQVCVFIWITALMFAFIPAVCVCVRACMCVCMHMSVCVRVEAGAGPVCTAKHPSRHFKEKQRRPAPVTARLRPIGWQLSVRRRQLRCLHLSRALEVYKCGIRLPRSEDRRIFLFGDKV